MRSIALMLTLLLVAPVLSGCFGGGEGGEEESGSIFYFEQGEIPSTTWYHYPGSVASPFAVDATDFDAVVAANITSNLTGMSTPFFTEATYYGTGYDTFEPTIGITSSWDQIYRMNPSVMKLFPLPNGNNQ